MELPLRKDAAIAVVGGGLSGSALAVRLLERPGLNVTLIDRAGAFGRGLAYSTTCDRHLLNVRAGRMSLRAEAPDHFVRWLERRGLPADPQGFARRSDYGAYVGEALAAAEERAPGRLRRVVAEVAALTPGGDGVALTLDDGTTLCADAAVLALGNPPPASLGLGLDQLDEAYVADPWAHDALAGIGADDAVLLIGTGLTAVDVLLALETRGWRGRATALSRHGLLPRAHTARAEHVDGASPPGGAPSQRLGVVRRWARERPWPEVMDRLRPHGQAMWAEADAVERARFLRHLRAWWDVHRHRMAPQIAEAVERWRGEGRLQVVAGRLQTVERHGEAVEVGWRPRRALQAETLRVRWVVNCTGPQTHPARADSPLLRGLSAQGVLRADAFGLGVDADAEGRVFDGRGALHDRLFAIGPLAKGALWEVVAAPEIRVQAEELAARLHARFSPRGALDRVFLSHPRDVGESYFEHMATAFGVGGRMIAGGAACLVHGVAPALFGTTGSRTIRALHARISGRKPGPPEA